MPKKNESYFLVPGRAISHGRQLVNTQAALDEMVEAGAFSDGQLQHFEFSGCIESASARSARQKAEGEAAKAAAAKPQNPAAKKSQSGKPGKPGSGKDGASPTV